MATNPVLHEGVQVIDCDCGGCYGEIDTPYVAMVRGTYEFLVAEVKRLLAQEACLCDVGVQECPMHPGRLLDKEEKIAFRKDWDDRVS